MNSVLLILFYSLSLAFCWINYGYPVVRKWLPKKPFGCGQCMTGWFALSLGIIGSYGWQSALLMCAGVFVGAMFEGIKMRWL